MSAVVPVASPLPELLHIAEVPVDTPRLQSGHNPKPSYAARLGHCHKQAHSHKDKPSVNVNAAFVVAGHPRTFVLNSVFADMRHNAMIAFQAHAYLFLLLSADDHGSTKGHVGVHSNTSLVVQVVEKLPPADFRLETEQEARVPAIPADCTLVGTRAGDYKTSQPWWIAWWQTWDRLHRAFRMVHEFEDAHKMRFDWVVRLRPDAWFFAPAVAHCELNPADGIVTPAGVAGCHAPCVNDHLAWVPRQMADMYFQPPTELENCHGTGFHHEMRDYGYFLRRRVEKAGGRFADSRLVPYSIVRPCSSFAVDKSASPDCYRWRDRVFKQYSDGHPGVQRIPNLTVRVQDFYTQCRSRWLDWPSLTQQRRALELTSSSTASCDV